MTNSKDLDALAAELTAFCDKEGLPRACADDLVNTHPLTPAQREWLIAFGNRWDALNQPEADWSASSDADDLSDAHDADGEIPY